MSMQTAVGIQERIQNTYWEKFPKCRAAHQKLIRYIPGGATRSLSYFKPFPIHIDHGKGARVYTPEGHELLDVTNAYGALVHGHGDPDVVQAVRGGIGDGSQFSTPTRGQYQLARLLCDRVPGFDRVRFLNSGTEATLFALRTARALTGRNKILKMSGGFHGTHDCVAASTQKNVITAGIPPAMTVDMMEVPFNDADALERTVTENAGELAAVIMEPFLGAGGVVLPKPDLLERARAVTAAHDVLLIFDEIFSFRVDEGGCQKRFGVTPDITCVGKVVGGGLPIGVFGGTEEVMQIYCHESVETPLYHSGTFNGYETVMQAGLAAMSKYDAPAIERLNRVGESFQEDLLSLIQELGLKIQSNNIGSLLNLHFTDQPVVNAGAAQNSVAELHTLFHLSLLNKGVFNIPRGLFILSTPLTREDMGGLVDKIGETLKELLPLIEEKYNHLLQ
ncbi:MAG: aspartate aminotransferase family protein [Desulfobacterales bacterium]|nr:aspartate aminotransferase family protein [Desulfobacterales bacterium]